jgi:hypothetical protein
MSPPVNPEVEILLENEDFLVARVKSQTQLNTWYNVFFDKTYRTASCECDGFFNHEKCWHTDEIIRRADKSLPN